MGKKEKPSRPSGGAKPAGPAALTSLKAALTSRLRPVIMLLLIAVTFRYVLPFLADLTPPGVDIKLIRQEAEKRALRAKDKCASVCDGMSCPEGWETGRSPEDHCKCICVRKDPLQATKWDKEHNQAQFFEGGEEKS
jgi:hypothetical protein